MSKVCLIQRTSRALDVHAKSGGSEPISRYVEQLWVFCFRCLCFTQGDKQRGCDLCLHAAVCYSVLEQFFYVSCFLISNTESGVFSLLVHLNLTANYSSCGRLK